MNLLGQQYQYIFQELNNDDMPPEMGAYFVHLCTIITQNFISVAFCIKNIGYIIFI